MFKAVKKPKNYLNCNDLIIKAMFKRRKLALAAIAHINDDYAIIRVVK